MKLLRILSYVAILGLAFTSCSKDDSSVEPLSSKKQLVEISWKSDRGTDDLTIVYDSKNRVAEMIDVLKLNQDPVIKKIYKFNYSEQGKISGILECDEFNNIEIRYAIIYAGSKRAIDINNVKSHMIKKIEQELNSEGFPINEKTYSYSPSSCIWELNRDNYVYEWSNGSLMSTTKYSGSTVASSVTSFQYGTNLNNNPKMDALWSIGRPTEYLPYIFNSINPSKNDIEIKKEESGYSTMTYKFKNTYDVDGYLIKSETSKNYTNMATNSSITSPGEIVEYIYK